MIKIEEGKVLSIENVICYRGAINPNEIQDRMIELGKYIEKCGAVVNGSVVTTTHRVFDDCKIDMEIILPINKKVLSCNKMIFKNKIKIYDALYARHMGHPNEILKTYDVMNKYITENNYSITTTGYNVAINNSINNDSSDGFIMDVYIGINRNIL